MAPSSRKRKHDPLHTEYSRSQSARNTIIDTSDTSHPDPSLLVVAHEADLVRGPQAVYAADSLEVTLAQGEDVKKVGDSLIKWERHEDEEKEHVWVDRYDARLLLDSLPTSAVLSTSSATLPRVKERSSSPSGWSDLPSDTEDTFFFSPEETEDYHRDKRRRQIDQLREDRLKALREEEANDPGNAAEELWGGSDEEPDDAQATVMRRTATHVLLSPNPAHLEMRIMANHGGDPRFAFLRGRWPRAWARTKASVRQEKAAKEEREEGEKERAKGPLGGLMAYDDSDSEGEADGAAADSTEGQGDGAVSEEHTAQSARDEMEQEDNGRSEETDAEKAVKKARRMKAKQWAEARRAFKASGDVDSQGEIDNSNGI